MTDKFDQIRRAFLEAQAKGLTSHIPVVTFDVPEGEEPAETVARMERMAGFVPPVEVVDLGDRGLVTTGHFLGTLADVAPMTWRDYAPAPLFSESGVPVELEGDPMYFEVPVEAEDE